MAHHIETLMLEGLSDQAPEAPETTTELPKDTTRMSRSARRSEKRRARKAANTARATDAELAGTATSKDASEPHPQLPLPKLLPASKPEKSTPIQTPLQCWHDWWFSPPWDADKRD